jgi:glycosyltransferase involved in cell wall biosynthesis
MISVCVATYNGEAFIQEQLNSILSQLSENDEVIVSDDGSTDNTKTVCESFVNKQGLIVKYFYMDIFIVKEFKNLMILM